MTPVSNFNLLTIHDAILTTPDCVDFVCEAIREQSGHWVVDGVRLRRSDPRMRPRSTMAATDDNRLPATTNASRQTVASCMEYGYN